MTLLLNEIHVPGDLCKSEILFAADRRVSLPGQSPPKFMKKIMEIPYLNAGIGYYGLAEVQSGVYLSSWLPNFINNSTEARTLDEFATKLRAELNRAVNKTWLMKQPSGFHICGYNTRGFPELWHVCNHGMEGNSYKDFAPEYGLSEDFLRRDAVAQGFDGTNPFVRRPFVQYYINGDVRPFHSAWDRLAGFSEEMFSYTDFKSPRRADEYIEVIKWKFKVIASFYQRFAKQPVIGGPTDAFVLVPQA
jgi:hypothetical protein